MGSGDSRGQTARRLLGLATLLLIVLAGFSLQPGPAPRAQSGRPLFIAFYDGWDPAARRGLEAKLPLMDVFAPRWITVRGSSAQVQEEPDEGLPRLIAAMAHPPRVFPIVSNAHDEIWDAPAADTAILDRAARARFAARLAAIARARGYAGYVMDFENMSARASGAYPALLEALKGALAPAGREVWVTAPVAADLPPLATASDGVVVMAYDECWASSNPGPIAGKDWLADVLAQRMPSLDPRRVILALASYGYDWPARSAAKPVGVPDARALAARYGAKISRDPASGDQRFAYLPPGGPRHEVWFIDAAAFGAQERLAADYGLRGVALWRLGLEDPAIWSLPRAEASTPQARPAPTAALPHPCDPLPR